MSVESSNYQRKDLEFREHAIQMALAAPKNIASTARRLGINASTLYSWVQTHNKFLKSQNKQHQTADIYAENALLKKENARLKEERDILKKAATYFAKASDRGMNL
jgi:transposase